MRYFRLKDRKSSPGALISGKMYNNATVTAYESVPSQVQIGVKNQILEECSKKDFDQFEKGQAEAAAYSEKVKAERNDAKKNRIAAKTGVYEEAESEDDDENEDDEKAPAKKKTTRKPPVRTKKVAAKEEPKADEIETPEDDEK